ncbi:MAG: methyltransferase [Candidatus Omnitrophica bacterium]|nr:methyltransferase [Candidatus Omnitrophota bacterium]
MDLDKNRAQQMLEREDGYGNILAGANLIYKLKDELISSIGVELDPIVLEDLLIPWAINAEYAESVVTKKRIIPKTYSLPIGSYQKIADIVNWLKGPLAKHNNKAVENFNRTEGPAKIVDMGTGDGLFLINYRRKYPGDVIIGFDSYLDESVTVSDINSRAHGIVIQDGGDTGIESMSVQKVTINQPDPTTVQTTDLMQRLIKEAWRILQDNGKLYITIEDVNNYKEKDPERYDFLRNLPTLIQEWLIGQGFEIEINGESLEKVEPDYPKSSFIAGFKSAIFIARKPVQKADTKKGLDAARHNAENI